VPGKLTFKEKISSPSEDGDVPQSGEIKACPESVNAGTSPYQFDINVFEMVRLILQKRRPVVWTSLTITILVAFFLFLKPNLYTSTATILPSGKSSDMSALRSLMGGLGGQFATADENSSALFPVILRSNLTVDAVLEKVYTFRHDSEEKTIGLTEYLGSDNPDRLRQNLRDMTTITSNKKTGEIRVGVETKYPALSQAVLTEYLAQLEDFNLHKRRSSARENERYLANQLLKINEELKIAEDNLEAFQKNNLDWAISGSPEILKELGQLKREVSAKSNTYVMLLQQYEIAKLDAQKDIPIISILDPPSLPTMKSGPFRRNMILLSGVAVFMLVIFTIVIWDLVRKGSDGANRYDRDALGDYLRDTFPRTLKILHKVRIVT
jgi:uncharacterized protein involved in exopolysaccharide biosynthesis